MNFRLKIAAASVLAVSFVACYGQTSETQPPVKKHTTARKAKKTAESTVAEQIQSLRHELESQASQIDSLKTGLADKDAQMKRAELAAANAQAAADKAEEVANAQQQAAGENTAAVTTLQATVTDLKDNQLSLATTVSDETAKIKKEITNPGTLHYKGIGLTPGGFLAGETIYRSKATGGDIPTAFSSIPYEGADAYSLSEFYGSARGSRITLLAEGKVNWGTLRGYYEADWLGSGTNSNANQSNSYVLRERLLYAEAKTNGGWTVDAGQMWSLATEGKKGISAAPGDMAGPMTIDPNNYAGFIWARQFGFRVVKSFDHAAFGISIENPQLLYSAALAGNTPYAVLGSAGNNGGNYNATISSVTASTYIQNYKNQAVTGGTGEIYVPVYNTITANTNVANLSFNQAPDIILKAAIDPGWGHYEIFGIGGFAHETVYPGMTTNSVKYGGQTDITGFNGGAPGTAVLASSSTAGSYSNSIIVGGVGASLRVPLLPNNKLTFGAKGLYGPGVGRYGNTTLSDVTNNASGELAPIHNLSGALTLEANPTPRLALYAYYGGDYAGRADFGTNSTIASTLGSPAATLNAAGTTWGGHWSTPTVGTTAVGYGSRQTSNSACTSIVAPGYNTGSSTGYQPGGSCSANTRNVQEVTAGYWYDIYKGDKGRLRQSVQYGYAVREGWSGVGGIGAKGIDNMVWTSLRYYLP